MANRARGSLPLDETFDVSGEKIVLDSEDDFQVGLHIRGDSNAEFSLDVSDTPGEVVDWFEETRTFSGTEIDERFEEGTRYIRLRVNSVLGGSAGDTAECLLHSSGGEW